MPARSAHALLTALLPRTPTARAQMMALMSQKLQMCNRAHLNVWKSKIKCQAGVTYTFGGNEGRDTLLGKCDSGPI